MGVFDRIFGGIADTIKLNDRVAGIASEVKDLTKDTRDIDRRLTRVETALDLLTKGAFAAPTLDVRPEPTAIEDKTKRARRNKPPAR